MVKLTVLILTFLVVSCSHSPVKRTDKLSIIQGVTNTKEVEFSVVVLKEKKLHFELRSEEDEIIAPDEVKVVTRDFSPYAIHKMVFIRDPKRVYNLYAYEGPKIIDQRLVGKGQIN